MSDRILAGAALWRTTAAVAPATPEPPKRPSPRVSDYFFRTHHLVAVLIVCGLVAAAFVGNAYPDAGIEFVPSAIPDRWGTIYLLPLVLQLVMAGLSMGVLVSPLWMSAVFVYCAICTLLVMWSLANVLVSLVVYVPTLSGLTLGLTGLALFFETFLLVFMTAMELAALVFLVPMVFPRHAGAADRGQTKEELEARGMRTRLWIFLATLLVFVLVLYLYALHTEPSTRFVLEFWPTSGLQRAATFWLILQPLLYIFALVALVIRPGRAESTFLLFFLILDAVALVFALMSLASTIVALIYYVPTATPFAPVAAGTIMVLFFSLISPGVDIALIYLILAVRRRVERKTL